VMVNVFASYLAQLPRKLQKIRWHSHCQKRSTEAVRMKKRFLSIACLLALSLTAIPVGAQTRYRRVDNYRQYEQRVADSRYRNQLYRERRWNRALWDQRCDKL